MENGRLRVLITGANSYIGTTFEQWVKDNGELFEIDTLDMIGEAWRGHDFSKYDVVFHVAGIAHADVGKVSEEQKTLYYKVNSDLTKECAEIAKASGVKQFIFMSSIIVYGESAGIGKKREINKDTPLAPSNFYGDSKKKAEEGILPLADESFKVVIIRPPMIYGKGSKGNYPLLSKLAIKLPVFPAVNNQRSMLYVENLCKFISLMIINGENGIFFPQNKEYVNTSNMVSIIASCHKKKIVMTPAFNWALFLMGAIGGRMGGMVNKAFGNMIYEKSMSEYKEDYRLYDLEESIRRTE